MMCPTQIFSVVTLFLTNLNIIVIETHAKMPVTFLKNTGTWTKKINKKMVDKHYLKFVWTGDTPQTFDFFCV